MTRGRVVVIGGGLAGVAAALRCADRGFEVALLEARTRLGGATYSFQRGDLAVDTGQHVFLRCYSTYADLLRRFGVADRAGVQSRFRVSVLSPQRRSSVLRRWHLPAPVHLAPALLGYRALALPQRLRAMRTAMALRGLDPTDAGLDEISLGAWLRDRGESDGAVRALWGLLAVAALNADPDEASMALAARVFRTGMLESADAADIGVPQLSLGELHGRPAHRVLVESGVDVRTRTRARSVHRSPTGLNVFARDGGGGSAVEADAVVVAVPHQAAASLLADLPLPDAERWSRLSAAPIVNVHVVYDRQVTDLALAAAIDSPVQWIFDRTRAAGAARGQYLVISLSAAHDYIDMRTGELRALFLPALAQLLPRAGGARVLDFFATREPSATFRQEPGTAAIRPPARTGIPGLVLAGAWTDTGWPDTTEGAVRSGIRAAEVVDLDQQRSHRGVEVSA